MQRTDPELGEYAIGDRKQWFNPIQRGETGKKKKGKGRKEESEKCKYPASMQVCTEVTYLIKRSNLTPRQSDSGAGERRKENDEDGG